MSLLNLVTLFGLVIIIQLKERQIKRLSKRNDEYLIAIWKLKGWGVPPWVKENK